MKPRNQIIAIKTKSIPFDLENLKTVPKKTGVYEFHDGSKFLYIGVAGSKGSVGNLHHRLLSYQEKDNFGHDDHQSKIALRNYLDNHSGVRVKFCATSIDEARRIEHLRKNHTLFNQDNDKNMKR